MKILFFRQTELKELNPEIMNKQGLAGTENSLLCLAHELSKRHTVKIITSQSKQQFFGNVEYIPFQSHSEVYVYSILFNPDVVIISGNPEILFNIKFSSLKVIFWQQNHPRELDYRFNIKKLLSSIQIVAPSPEAAQFYNLFYNTSKIIGIYNGVRPQFFNQTRNPTPNKITYCGSFTRAKGLDLVLKAAKELQEFQFYLCGAFDLYGFEDTTYKKYCLQQMSSNVHLLGSLTAQQLANEFSTSSLCIANPIIMNNETCCNSALEAIVVGTPVIVGHSEILSNIISTKGIVSTNLSQSIRDFMNNPVVFDNKSFIEKLRWESIAKQWESILCKSSF